MDWKDLQKEGFLREAWECPVCHKGRMRKGAVGWICDYFHSPEEKCAFTIFASYQGYDLTENDVLELTGKGETGRRVFRTLSGVSFVARMRIIEGKVKVVRESRILQNRCPACSGAVKETRKGFICENFFKEGEDQHCRLYIRKEICGHPISVDEAENLLVKRHTEPIDGFSRNGKNFTSCLVLQPDGTVVLDGKICRCPKCGGHVYAGVKAYNCSNYRVPGIHCGFVIWRNMHGRDITTEDVKSLCENLITPLMAFKTKKGDTIRRSLSLDDSFNIRLV